VRTTEFGRGYATCLFMFVMHEPMLEDDKMITFYRERMGYTRAKADDQHVTLWANGASDHLYDLITGPRVPQLQRKRAKAVASIALRCGHGFTNEVWTLDQARFMISEARELLVLAGDPKTLDEAQEIDRRLGLRPELGISCAEPLTWRLT
jgi:hypothetical protein